MRLNQRLFEQRLAALRGVPGLNGQHVDHLAALLQDPDDWKCFRVNPLRFAKDHGIPQRAALDLFLHGVRAGLLELRFNLVCPMCGGIEYQLSSLDAVPSRQFHCLMCQLDSEAELDDRVEVGFSVEVGVRELEFDTFKNAAGYQRFFFSSSFERSAPFQRFLDDATRGPYSVAPGSDVSLTLEVKPGFTWRLMSLDTHSQVALPITSGGERSVEITALSTGLGPASVAVASGPVAVRVVNRGTSPVGFVVEGADRSQLGDILGAHPNRFHPFFTARMLLNNQTFRDVFRVQSLDVNMRLRLRSLTLLFTDLKGSTQLYDKTGDIRAYTFVREHFKVLTEAVKRHNGALVKTMGDAIMASFNEPTDAAQAALEMMQGMDSLNADLKAEGHDTGLKVGLHEGPALAVTADERLDYFGQTVNVAARVQGQAEAGEIVLTPGVMDSPGVRATLLEAGWKGGEEQVALKGVAGNTRVFRLHR